MPSAQPATKPAPLDLQQIYTWLLADGMIRKTEVKELYAQSQAILKNTVGPMHPLCAVAHAKLLSAQPPHKMLTLDALCEWLAQRTGLLFIRIDPLKIDFTKVADVMSASYAARFNILPVELTHDTLVVATADPCLIEWEAEISKVSRRAIRRVIANPLDICLLYTSPSPRDRTRSRMPSSA